MCQATRVKLAVTTLSIISVVCGGLNSTIARTTEMACIAAAPADRPILFWLILLMPMPAVRQAAGGGDDGGLRRRNWRQFVVQLPPAAQRFVESSEAKDGRFCCNGYLFPDPKLRRL